MAAVPVSPPPADTPTWVLLVALVAYVALLLWALSKVGRGE